MSTIVTLAPPASPKRAAKAKPSRSKLVQKEIISLSPTLEPAELRAPALPTFSWESGYRLVKDPETGEEPPSVA